MTRSAFITQLCKKSGIAVGLLLVVHAALLTWSALSASVCFDEYAHLPAGLSYCKYREFGMLNLTPPLLRIWAATPVLAAGPEIPPLEPYREMRQKDRYWAYADAFMRANADRYQTLFVIGRLAMIPISCFGAWVVYCWARSLYGAGGGLTACAVYVLCPNILAHGSIVGTDTGTAVAFVSAGWLWWRFCKAPGATRLALATLAMGAAHLCKFSAPLLWPVFVLIACVTRPVEPSIDRRKWLTLAAGVLIVGTLLIINTGYLFEGTGHRAGSFQLQSSAGQSLMRLTPAACPIPLPEQMVLGFDALKWEVEQGFQGFLFGEVYHGSRWYYFPVALAVKLPLATLLLIGLSVVSMFGFWGFRKISRDEAAVAGAGAIILLGLMFLAGVNLGVRYVLPALPFAFILTGRLWRDISDRPRWRSVVQVLLVILLIEQMVVAPRYLTFFNLLAGGPLGGQRILNDSNADWGQGLLDLKRWMKDHNVPRVQLGYFGRVDPAIYGIDYDLLTKVSGAPYIAVSSYYLMGLTQRLPSPDGPTGPVRIEFFRELQQERPVAVVGSDIYIYRRQDVTNAIMRHREAR